MRIENFEPQRDNKIKQISLDSNIETASENTR